MSFELWKAKNYLMQTNMPRFQLAHLGSENREHHQSVPAHHRDEEHPKHTLIPLAVGAGLVSFKLQESLDCLLVLSRTFGGWIWGSS